MSLFASRAESLVLSSVESMLPSDIFAQARLCVGYLMRVKDQEAHLNAAFSGLYGNSWDWTSRPKAVVNVYRAVINAVSLLYRQPPRRKFASDMTSEAFSAQRNFDRVMPDVDRLARASGLVLLRPVAKTRAGGKRVEFITYPSDCVEWRSDPEDPLSPNEVTLTWREGSAVRQQIWTAEGARVLVDGIELPDQYIENEIDELPFAWFSNEVPQFTLRSEPSLDLVNSCLHINHLLTLGNWTMTNQTAPPLFTTGVKKSPGWKLGANRIWSAPAGATAQFLPIPVNTDELLSMLDKNWKLFLASWRIPESAIVVEQVDRSGVAIIEEREALADYRDERARCFEQPELDAIRVSLKVMERHGLARSGSWKDVPSIDYTPVDRLPNQEERAALDWMVDRGAMTAAERVQRLLPGVGAEEAEAKLDAAREQRQESGAVEMLRLLAAKKRSTQGDEGGGEE